MSKKAKQVSTFYAWKLNSTLIFDEIALFFIYLNFHDGNIEAPENMKPIKKHLAKTQVHAIKA